MLLLLLFFQPVDGSITLICEHVTDHRERLKKISTIDLKNACHVIYKSLLQTSSSLFLPVVS